MTADIKVILRCPARITAHRSVALGRVCSHLFVPWTGTRAAIYVEFRVHAVRTFWGFDPFFFIGRIPTSQLIFR